MEQANKVIHLERIAEEVNAIDSSMAATVTNESLYGDTLYVGGRCVMGWLFFNTEQTSRGRRTGWLEMKNIEPRIYVSVYGFGQTKTRVFRTLVNGFLDYKGIALMLVARVRYQLLCEEESRCRAGNELLASALREKHAEWRFKGIEGSIDPSSITPGKVRLSLIWEVTPEQLDAIGAILKNNGK